MCSPLTLNALEAVELSCKVAHHAAVVCSRTTRAYFARTATKIEPLSPRPIRKFSSRNVVSIHLEQSYPFE